LLSPHGRSRRPSPTQHFLRKIETYRAPLFTSQQSGYQNIHSTPAADIQHMLAGMRLAESKGVADADETRGYLVWYGIDPRRFVPKR